MRDRSDGCVFHRTMVNAHDGCDADSGAGEEEFVTYVQFAAVDGSLDDTQPELAECEFHDAIAGDAFEGVFGHAGSDELAVAHHEEVAGGAFGNVSAFVEEDGFVESCLP